MRVLNINEKTTKKTDFDCCGRASHDETSLFSCTEKYKIDLSFGNGTFLNFSLWQTNWTFRRMNFSFVIN